MEKQFSITFDLSKMQVLIPSGRLMNLKERLNWDDIDCSHEEIKQLTQHVSSHDFQVNMDFKAKTDAYVNNIMNGKYHKEARKASYIERGIKHVENPKSFLQVTNNLTEELKGQLAEIFDEIKEDEQIKKKMLKLSQLQFMNN
jgi:hypothetical protein